jgi:DNA replication and repair protein RecF
MRISRLSLANFRNYSRLDLSPPAGRLLFLGSNAQGKTNLLEAIYLLSTMRSLRVSGDAELIRWEALDEALPAARLVADAETPSGPVRVEMAVEAQQRASAPDDRSRATKRVRVNGAPKRTSGAMGRIKAVLFTSQDIDLVGGAPALRRRYLDLALSQVEEGYLGALQQYNKTLVQRNALLHRIQSGLARRDELGFWNGRFAQLASGIASRRAHAVAAIARNAAETHGSLTDGRERLAVTYRPRWSRDWDDERIRAVDPAETANALLDTLNRNRERELAAAASLWGPHRDDLAFTLNDRPADAFASRAQARTIALALRLAEARLLLDRSGDHPILLLDDILSEMDTERRLGVLEAVSGFDQVWLTSAEQGDTGRIAAGATVFTVNEGQVRPLEDAVRRERSETAGSSGLRGRPPTGPPAQRVW